MKQYNKLGLIAAVIIVLTILFCSNASDLARLSRYEPVPTDSPLLVNIAVSNAMILISLKLVFYAYIIYYSLVLFYKVYQKDTKKKEAFDNLAGLLKEFKQRKERAEGNPVTSRHNNNVAVDINLSQAKEEEQPLPFNPKVVDIQFEPKISNNQRLECYNTFNSWVSAIISDKTIPVDKALVLNKFIRDAKDLIHNSNLDKTFFHSNPKFVVQNINTNLKDLESIKGYLTNEVEEYITSLIPVVKKYDIGEIIP